MPTCLVCWNFACFWHSLWMEYAGPVLQVTLLNICLSFFSFNRGVVSVICHTYSTLEIKLGEAQPKLLQNFKLLFYFSVPFRICAAMFVQKPNSLVNSYQKISLQKLLNSAALKEWKNGKEWKNMANYWLEGTAQWQKLLCKGRIGDWKNYFTPEHNKMFENEVMNKLIGTGLEFDFEGWAWSLSWRKILKCYLLLVVCITVELWG